MGSIYLGGTFHPFTSQQILARQEDLQRRLHSTITVHKPLPKDLYPADLGSLRDQTLTERDRYLVRRSDIIVLDHSACGDAPPRGILIETGWATAWNIPVLLIIEPTSPARFNMLNSLVTWEVATREQAASILNTILAL